MDRHRGRRSERLRLEMDNRRYEVGAGGVLFLLLLWYTPSVMFMIDRNEEHSDIAPFHCLLSSLVSGVLL